jgi:hypothetical protein
MQVRHVVGVILSVLLAGCSMQYPQNAAEFRKMLPESSFGTKEEINSSRSVAEIGATFKKMAPQCLDVRIRSEERSNTSYHVVVTRYKPTVIAGPQKVELHVQMEHEKGVITPGKVPPGGLYLMIIDVTPAGNGKSKAVFYRPSMGYDAMVKGITGWITGENIGCPDLTK